MDEQIKRYLPSLRAADEASESGRSVTQHFSKKSEWVALLVVLLTHVGDAAAGRIFPTREGPTRSHQTACESAGAYWYGTTDTNFSTGPIHETYGLCTVSWDRDPPPPDYHYSVSFYEEPSCPPGQAFDVELNMCAPTEHAGAPNTGDPGQCESIGNPIGFLRGNKYQREVDLEPQGNPLSVGIIREYNSVSNGPDAGLFGRNWRSLFDTRLLMTPEDPLQLSIIRVDGRRERFFYVQSTELWEPADTTLNSLSQSLGFWIYNDNAHADKRTYTFRSDGRLVEIADKRGNSLAFKYEDSVLISVTDAKGRELKFSYQGSTLASIATPNGEFRYTLDGQNLVAVARPDLGQRIYHYENSQHTTALTAITDERGIRYAEWDYDEQGRAFKSRQLAASGEVLSEAMIDFTYADRISGPRVIVINELGRVTHYLFATIAGYRKITSAEGRATPYCPAANRRLSYSQFSGRLTSSSDWKGVLTYYEYDSHGRETKRTEALGKPDERVTYTEWHPTLNQPVKITTPNRITFIQYDTEGREVSRRISSREY